MLVPRNKKVDLAPSDTFIVARFPSDLNNLVGSKGSIDETLFDAQSSAVAQKKKKKINIPITDVTIDQEYEKMVNSNFIVPKSYIHYSRRIGDETDITLNYNLDMNVSEYICV